MRSLFQYINEATKDQLSNWYDDKESYDIKGEDLPLSVTKNIRCSFHRLDWKKPLSVIVQKEEEFKQKLKGRKNYGS